VPEGVFKRRLLKPTAQPAELDEGGETSTSKLGPDGVPSTEPTEDCVCYSGSCQPCSATTSVLEWSRCMDFRDLGLPEGEYPS
jgi:hypothetical protein